MRGDYILSDRSRENFCYIRPTSYSNAETWTCGKVRGEKGRAHERECVYTSSVCVNGDHRRRRPSRRRRSAKADKGRTARTWERERVLASPWLRTDGRTDGRTRFESEGASELKESAISISPAASTRLCFNGGRRTST